MICRYLAVVEAWIELALVHVFYFILRPVAKWTDRL